MSLARKSKRTEPNQARTIIILCQWTITRIEHFVSFYFVTDPSDGLTRRLSQVTREESEFDLTLEQAGKISREVETKD